MPLSGNDRNGYPEGWFLLLYAITNRRQLAETEDERTRRLVELAESWVAYDIDFVQIREKDMTPTSLIRLAAEIIQAVKRVGASTRVLINVAPNIATAVVREAGADGVHLSGGLADGQLRAAIREIRDGLGRSAPISVSCHSSADVVATRGAAASLALFAPVFEKVLPGSDASHGMGIEALSEACRVGRETGRELPIPVLALGGVTFENASQCVAAGAAGIAAIRLFQARGEERELEWRELASR